MSENYVEISAKIVRRTRDGVLFDVDGTRGWVGRSCLHYRSDKDVESMADGEEGSFRMMEWVAEKNGFI